MPDGTSTSKRSICDMHVHTKFSCDSQTDIDAYCKSAIAKGMSCVCFTDHIDYNPVDDGYQYYNAEAFFKEFNHCRDRYADKILLLCGIEFSGPNKYKAEFEACLKLPYDYIIGSVHYWHKDMFPSEMTAANVPLEVCFEGYWKEILAAVRFGGFDCLGHIDFPKRYYKQLLYDETQLCEILHTMVSNNICIEINTSSLRKGLDETMPGSGILRLYQASGGQFAAVGSDAHAARDLAADYSSAKRLIEEFGLTEVIYKNREQIPVSEIKELKH